MLRRRLPRLFVAALGVAVVVAGCGDFASAQPNLGEAIAPRRALDLFGDPLPADALMRLGSSRFWTAEPCSYVAYSQDGGKLVAAGRHGAYVFAATSGKRLRHIATARRAVDSISLSPDGRYLALGTQSMDDDPDKCGIQIWDLATGRLRRECKIKDTWVPGVIFSPDGTMLASYSGRETVSLWDAATGKEIRRWPVSRAWDNRVGFTFSRDSSTLIVGDQRTIHFLRIDASQLIPRPHYRLQSLDVLAIRVAKTLPDEPILGLYSVGPDGTVNLGLSYGTVKLIGLTFEEAKNEIETHLKKVLKAPEVSLTVAQSRGVQRDTATGKEARRIADHPGARVCKLVLSPDGKILASQAHTGEGNIGGDRTRDKKVYLWDTATGKLIRQIEVVEEKGKRNPFSMPLEIYDFQFSPDTKFLATASDHGVLRVWDVATGKEQRHWDTADWAHAIAYAPDGETLASLGSGHAVRRWDPATGKERQHPSQRNRFGVLELSPDGRTLAAAGIDGDVRLWDTTTGKQLKPLIAGAGNVSAIRFAADGRALTALDDDGKARTWDVAAGKELRQLPVPFKEKSSMHVLSPDGKTWASVVWDGAINIVLWDAATGKKRQVLVGDFLITALTFSPDGRTVYCWRGYNWVQVWDVATGKTPRGFPAGETETGSFSPDGNWFACVGSDRVLLLYDIATGDVVRRIQVQGKFFFHAESQPHYAYSPDGRTLAVADTEGTIHLLELASGKFRRRLAGGHQGNIGVLLFSADGRRLISGSADMTAIVWDFTGRLNANTKPLGAMELDDCWALLAGDDAEAADRAIRRLAASPAEALPYLAKKLQPAASADPRCVARLIIDLDDDQFAVRERASRELEKLGETATALCRKALAGGLSAEAHQRLERLLKKQEQQRLRPSRERLRIQRALEALEFAGTPEARQLLQKLAGGVAEAFITREAKASLRLLTKKDSKER